MPTQEEMERINELRTEALSLKAQQSVLEEAAPKGHQEKLKIACPDICEATVKVMRSYDYCHFEVTLKAQEFFNSMYRTPISQAQIDELRKTAARLADKAVEQYKVAKDNAQRRERAEYNLDLMRERAAAIEQKPEQERTPEEQAILKTIADRAFALRRHFDYEDDWQEPDYGDDE